MLIEADYTARMIEAAAGKLKQLQEEQISHPEAAELMLDELYLTDIGISKMMADFMPVDELVDFLNHTGQDWVKVAFCAHLMLQEQGKTPQQIAKAEEMLHLCRENQQDIEQYREFFVTGMENA